MLVLTRKLGQDLLIGENISVKVLRIDSNKVQLGISAPENIAIYRQELVEKIKSFNRIASRTDHNHLKVAAALLKNFFKI